jgi:hypothetical protein
MISRGLAEKVQGNCNYQIWSRWHYQRKSLITNEASDGIRTRDLSITNRITLPGSSYDRMTYDERKCKKMHKNACHKGNSGTNYHNAIWAPDC